MAPPHGGVIGNSRNEEEVMATMNVTTTDRRHIPERRTTSSGERHVVKLSVVDYIAMALVIIGGLNWASVALFNVDVVANPVRRPEPGHQAGLPAGGHRRAVFDLPDQPLGDPAALAYNDLASAAPRR